MLIHIDKTPFLPSELINFRYFTLVTVILLPLRPASLMDKNTLTRTKFHANLRPVKRSIDQSI